MRKIKIWRILKVLLRVEKSERQIVRERLADLAKRWLRGGKGKGGETNG